MYIKGTEDDYTWISYVGCINITINNSPADTGPHEDPADTGPHGWSPKHPQDEYTPVSYN